jgi:hypothetical protein
MAVILLILEYEHLRREIGVVSKELRDTEKYVILIVSAIWVWLATNPDVIPGSMASTVWWLPVFVVILGIVRFMGVQQSLCKIASYIAHHIEPELLGKGKGWENYLESGSMRNRVRWWFSAFLLWSSLLIASIMVALNA